MMNRISSTSRPLLSKFEVEIPRQPAAENLEYDEAAMILVADGRPALYSTSSPPKPTRVTFVGQETTDDD